MNTKSFLISILVVSLIVLGYYGYQTTKEETKSPEEITQNNSKTQENNTVTPKVENLVTSYKLPEGEQVYNVSHGKEVVGPKAKQVSFSPLSINPGDKQTIKLVFPKDEQVSSGVIFVTTDNKENQKINLTKTDKNKDEWVGSWTVDDTISKRYNIRLYLVGPAGTYNNVMSFL